MSEAGDELQSPLPPSTPTGDTPIRSRTPPSWSNAAATTATLSSNLTPMTRLSPLRQQQQHQQRPGISPSPRQRVVSPLLPVRRTPPSNTTNTTVEGRPSSHPRSRSGSGSGSGSIGINISNGRPNSRNRTSSNRTPNRYASPISTTTPNRVLIRQEMEEEELMRMNQNHYSNNDHNDIHATTATIVDNEIGRQQGVNQQRRIQLGAGLMVGSVPHRILEENRDIRGTITTSQPPPTTKSIKQRPSHRKIRRWNNDKLVGIASEIVKTHAHKSKGEKLATAFLEGQAESYLYAIPNYPLEYRSAFATLSNDDSEIAQKVKEKFLKGEVASNIIPNHHHHHDMNSVSSSSSSSKSSSTSQKIATQMYQQINPRLRTILEKSYSSNPHSFAMELIRCFEWHLNSVFVEKDEKEKDKKEGGEQHLERKHRQEDWVVISDDEKEKEEEEDEKEQKDDSKAKMNPQNTQSNTIATTNSNVSMDKEFMDKIKSALLTAPTITRVKSTSSSSSSTTSKTTKSKKRLQYIFDANSSTGAYHRLLVHAICKFHGLHSVSSDTNLSIPNPNTSSSSNKALTGTENKNVRIAARVLTISGKGVQEPKLELLQHLKYLNDLKERRLKIRQEKQKEMQVDWQQRKLEEEIY